MASNFQKTKRQNMPSQQEVYDYWRDKIELYEPDKCCFACGRKGTLHRAHIMPCRSQGDNSLQNIHLLCPSCHHLTEGVAEISISLYWGVIKNKNYWIGDMLKTLIDISKEDPNKILMIQNEIYDRYHSKESNKGF